MEDDKEFVKINLDKLIELMTENLEISRSINLYKLNSIKTKRMRLAQTIVTRIAALNSLLSTLLPIIDIPLTSFITNTMLKLIATLSTKENKTLDTFLATYTVVLSILNILRAGSLLTGDALEFLGPFSFGVTFALGGLISASTAAVITKAVGNKAIKYFLDD